MLKKPLFDRIQDAIFNIEEGVGAAFVKFLIFVLLLGALMVVFLATQFKNNTLHEEDAFEAAQAARVLTERNAFETRYIRPMDFWFLTKRGELDIPYAEFQKSEQLDAMPLLSMAPGYPAVLSVAMRVLPPDYVTIQAYNFRADRWVVAVGLLFTLLAGFVIYFLGRRMFTHRTGMLAMYLFFVSQPVWKHAISGLETPLIAFLAAVAFWAAAAWASSAQRERPSFVQFWPWLALVLACAALVLTRYGAWIILPGLLLFLGGAMPRQGFLKGFVTLVIALCALAPWVLRNQDVSNSWFGTAPYLAMEDTLSYPGRSFERSQDITFKPQDAEFDLRRKVVSNLKEDFGRGLSLVGGGFFVSSFFFASLFFRFSDPKAAMLRWGVLLSLGLWALLAGAYGARGFRLIMLFVPVGCVYAAAFFHLLLQRMNYELRVSNQIVVGGLILAAALPLLLTLLPPRPHQFKKGYQIPWLITQNTSFFNQDEWLVSDIPERTAWYSGQTSLLLPTTVQEFESIYDHIRFCHGIYFTEKTRDLPFYSELDRRGNNQTWAPLVYGTGIYDNFPLPILHNDGNSPGHLLYLDRYRKQRSQEKPAAAPTTPATPATPAAPATPATPSTTKKSATPGTP